MIYFVLAALVAVVVELIIARLNMRAMIREHARERQLLMNQALHAANKTWQPPPAVEEPAEPSFDANRYFATPEQLPDL